MKRHPPSSILHPRPKIDGPAMIYGGSLHDLVPDRPAIRAEQKRDRQRHTVRVKSKLP